MIRVAFIILSLISVLGCQNTTEQLTSPTEKHSSPALENKILQFSGSVIYVPIEGGFWGVITDNKIRLDGNIPQKYKVEGLRVKGLYQVSGDATSYHMWGKVVNFVEFENE